VENTKATLSQTRKKEKTEARFSAVEGGVGKGDLEARFLRAEAYQFFPVDVRKSAGHIPFALSWPTVIACHAHHFPSSLYTWNWRPSALIEKAEKSAL
jgi:hypothetical protein